MPDQDEDSDRAPSFFIDYLRVEIVYLGSNAEAKKSENFEIFVKIRFSSIFHEIHSNFRKSNQNLNKNELTVTRRAG